ncbi:MAG TPA: amidohydrolase family protein [Acidimicrobiales bacterium]|nr:amidohydrolase family protein [Acidimicrobiales bacterium]
MRIDADSHVDETEATWDYLLPGDRQFRPECVQIEGNRDRSWISGGLSFRRANRDYRRTGATAETSQLLDVKARIEHLDRLNIDLQVIYPTMHIRSSYVGHADVELAQVRSYNRWIADRTFSTAGRLRWVAVLPLFSMDEAVRELEWAKEHGAVGVFKKSVECDQRLVNSPYFFPLYEAAAELGLPMCIHVGSEGPHEAAAPVALDTLKAFDPLINSDIGERFPALRFGFIESGASWVPYLLSLHSGAERRKQMQSDVYDSALPVDTELFERRNLYVACQSHEDIAYLLPFGLENRLMVGTDYTHADQSSEIQALSIIEQRALNGEIPMSVVEKMFDANPRRFYGL